MQPPRGHELGSIAVRGSSWDGLETWIVLSLVHIARLRIKYLSLHGFGVVINTTMKLKLPGTGRLQTQAVSRRSCEPFMHLLQTLRSHTCTRLIVDVPIMSSPNRFQPRVDTTVCDCFALLGTVGKVVSRRKGHSKISSVFVKGHGTVMGAPNSCDR